MLLRIDKELERKGTWSRPLVGACLIWGGMFAFVAFRASRFVLDSNECLTYAQATHNWWAHQALYQLSNIDGYLYLPQAAILYTPFARLGHPVGDVIWRFAGLSVFCVGLWRLANLLMPSKVNRVFAVATLLSFAPAFNSLRNAQVNLPLAGLMMHTAVDLAQKRWWRAGTWLTLGLALKPIMIVMLLLAGACYRPMILRLLACLAVLAILPFACASPQYSCAQLYMFCEKLFLAAQPDRLFSDLRSLIGWMGYLIPMPIYCVMQTLAALAALGVTLIAFRRWREPAAAVFLLALSACYLMLFNPRTEGNSYVILTPLLAVPAGILFVQNRRRPVAWVLAALTVLLTGNLWGYQLTVHWMKPLACIVFVALLVRELLYGAIEDWPLDARDEKPQIARPRIFYTPAKASSGFSNISNTLFIRQR